MNFQTTSKFVIATVRLILGKVGVDGFTRPRWESDVRFEKSKKLQTHHIWFLIKKGRFVNEKKLGFWTKLSKLCKILLKDIAHDYIYMLDKFNDQMAF